MKRWAWLLVVCLLGCGDNVPTQVVFNLSATPELAREAHFIEVTVTRQGGTVALQKVARLRATDADPVELILPATVPVVPLGGDASRRPTLSASLLGSDREVLSRVGAEVRFEANQKIERTLTFDAAQQDGGVPPAPLAVVQEVPRLISEPLMGTDAQAVPGSELSFEERPDLTWVIIASGRIRSPDALSSVEVRFMIDGSVRGIARAGTGQQWRSWQSVDFVRGGSETKTASLSVAGASFGLGGEGFGGTIELEETRIIAFPLDSMAADFQGIREGGMRINATASTLATLTFTPTPEEEVEYFIIASSGVTSGFSITSGMGTRSLWLTDRSGTEWPSGSRYRIGAGSVSTLAFARPVTFPPGGGSVSFELKADGGRELVVDSTSHVRLMAFRTAALYGFFESPAAGSLVANDGVQTGASQLSVTSGDSQQLLVWQHLIGNSPEGAQGDVAFHGPTPVDRQIYGFGAGDEYLGVARIDLIRATNPTFETLIEGVGGELKVYEPTTFVLQLP